MDRYKVIHILKEWKRTGEKPVYQKHQKNLISESLTEGRF